MSFLAEAAINHFSHVHPLQLFNHQDRLTPASCSGCKSEATGLIYTCSACNYFLHIKCAKMPQQINHPFDKDHVFNLLAKPPYAEGFFNCVACRKRGDGFSYHCEVCKTDLHILCVVAPLSLRHQSHMDHQLNLTFSPPYANKIFNCDICNTAGFDHWLYRCELCDFDVHLDCKNIPAAPIRETPLHRSHPEVQQPGTASRSPVQVPQAPHHQAVPPQYTATGIPVQNLMPSMNNVNQATHTPAVVPFGVMQNRHDDLLALQMLQDLSNSLQTLIAAGGVSGGVGSGFGGIGVGVGGVRDDLAGLQQLYQFFSGISAAGATGLGGGVGGDLSGMQQLNPLYSGVGAGDIGGLGGGLGSGIGGDLGGMQQLYQSFSAINAGGGGVPGLDFLGTTVGGGQNLLQAVMGDNGGGTLTNLLQALMGGGGSGGLDALIGLLGGFGL